MDAKSKAQTHLIFDHIKSADKANEKFGSCKDGNTIVMLQPGRNPIKPYLCIPEGMYAIVQRYGRDIDYVYPDGRHSPLWPAGFHMASVFTKIAYLVTKQNVVFDTPVKGCKTADNVTVHIDMGLVFRIMGDEEKGEDPALVKRFVYELGPQGLETQLRNAQEEAVRALARNVEHTEVYSLRDGTVKERLENSLQMRGPTAPLLPHDAIQEDEETKEEDDDQPRGKTAPALAMPVKYLQVDASAEHGDIPAAKILYSVTEDIKHNLNKQFNPYGVEISTVSITNVLLPQNFETQMEEKTTYQSAIKEQTMKQQSDMQLLQYKEAIDTTKLSKRMRRMEETEAGSSQCAEIQKDIDVIMADTKLLEAQIQQEQSVRCAKIVADADLSIAKIAAETEMIQTEIKAACDAEVMKILAERDALVVKMKADVDRLQALGDARVNEILADAEGAASSKLQLQREYLLKMQRLDITSAMASNADLVIAGNGNQNLLADVFVAQQKSNVLLNINGIAA
ncbi:hypothetical protein SPRG_13816 [Saprolegnia parasitica CBS 223.65]|uniref:Band 7 domain-containing protein n=1 Tax=Saprolegnia parasitica (strain CBS 223.65) TaxID=695850 RepID=A0A067BW97_SAPPC|nr:hypothetical protein SPRG_13816 [Saprolegnia parasitica CBS 223.65]KDO21110.1 hypothetical protein SPRG_13816 [Saprolegnia parasitica CBS 223.65]|eukprot:XP_012208202.1 hypothetical protein SPRG_13816 [Saprolegnia parasitica CBS 223.65]